MNSLAKAYIFKKIPIFKIELRNTSGRTNYYLVQEKDNSNELFT